MVQMSSRTSRHGQLTDDFKRMILSGIISTINTHLSEFGLDDAQDYIRFVIPTAAARSTKATSIQLYRYKTLGFRIHGTALTNNYYVYHGFGNDTQNDLAVFYFDTVYYHMTRRGGAQTTSALAGVDITTEGDIQVVWENASSSKLYWNGTLKATNTTNVPNTYIGVHVGGLTAGGAAPASSQTYKSRNYSVV